MTLRESIVCDERPGDVDAIRDVVASAFGGPDEARLVDALRAAGDLAISLVADVHGRIVGHVALSAMDAPFPALALAPVAVLPERQRRGFGAALVARAIESARREWSAIFVLGDPAYYERFGFTAGLAAGFASPYSGEHFMALALRGALPAASGTLRHAAAFAALGA